MPAETSNNPLLLSREQVAFRNAALVRNVRQSMPRASNYSDEQIIQGYDDWFMCQNGGPEDTPESAFFDYIIIEEK